MKRSRFQFGALAGIVSLFGIAMMTLGSIAPALSADSGSASVESIQKVGYIDSQVLRERLPEFKTVLRKLESLQRKYEQEAVERRNSILKLEEDFKEQQPLLSETRKVEMQAKIDERVRGLQEFTQSKFGPDGELFRHNVELSSPILERVKAMVQVLAKEEGYDAIHDVAIASATVNADSERHNLALTTKLLERLGKTQKVQQENDAGRISVSVMQDGSMGLSAQTSVSSIETLTSLLKELGVQFDVEHIDVASIANPDESHTLKVMEAVRSAGLAPRPAPTTNMESPQRVPAKLLVHLPQPDSVRVVVYNVQGGEVLTLYEGQSPQGDYTFAWGWQGFSGQPCWCRNVLCSC